MVFKKGILIAFMASVFDFESEGVAANAVPTV